MPNDSGESGISSSPTNFEAFTVPLEEISYDQSTSQRVMAGSSLEPRPSQSEALSWTDNGSLDWVISSFSSIAPLTPCTTPPPHVSQSFLTRLLPPTQGNSSTIDTMTSTRLQIIEQEEDLRSYGLRYPRRVQRKTEIIMGTFLLLGMALGLGSVLAINLGQSAGLGKLELRSWAGYTIPRGKMLW